MRTVIVGYGEMLKALVEGLIKSEHTICGVFRHESVSQPPLTKMFKDYCFPSKDKMLINKYGIKEINARSVNSCKFRKFLEKNNIDTVIVGSWSEKFSPQTINTPKYGVINVHSSLLPKYRGPNPYLQVILHGEKETGVTFHFMDVSYDTGAILQQKSIPIKSKDTGKTLRKRCCETVKQEIKILLDNFEEKRLLAKSQNENCATYQPQIKIGETILNFRKETAEETDRRIRALQPWAVSYIPYKHEYFSFKHHKFTDITTFKSPGTIVKKTDDSLFIACRDRKVMQFSGLKINRLFSVPLTKIYMKNIIKVNERAS